MNRISLELYAMKTRNGINQISLWVAISLVTIVHTTNIQAAPGQLAQSPLFLSNAVPPNIFFALDDSGSMNWETTLNVGTWNPGGVADTAVFDAGTGAHLFSDAEGMRSVCLGYNVLAYNPNFLYTPWRGEDEDGIPYSNRTLTTALHNPYDNDAVRNITNHYYFPWIDADADGQYDGPGSIGYLQGVGLGEECGDLTSTANGVQVNTLPAVGTNGAPNSQQNYANWWTYYRKRDFIMKRAVSELIWNSESRMGLGTLWNNNGVGTAVQDMTNITDKGNLLDALGRVNPVGGTPLRSLQRNVGKYFDRGDTGILSVNNGTTNNWGIANSSPILPLASGGACQQNFNVLFSDGFWNSDGGFTEANNDGDNNTAWDGASYADSFSNTLADVAMRYYETDLATSFVDNVPTITGVDENSAQHLVTYTVAFGVDGTITPATTGTDATGNPADPVAPFAWPQPVANTSTAVDDMRHAAWNARGEFLSARDPQTLISSLSAALESIADRTGSAAAVSFNSANLETNTLLFQSSFNTEAWSGDVKAFAIDPVDGSIATTETWSAGNRLDARNLGVSPRSVYTFNGLDGTRFGWNELTNAQKDDLRRNPDNTVANDTVAQARLAYIIGDQSNESGGFNFRPRLSRLGDIIHSSPIFVGNTGVGYSDSAAAAPYSTFTAGIVQSRIPSVYVGSNEGMLHGFDARDGKELLAYIPNFLYSTNPAEGMHYLTDPSYAHNYFVDLTTTISDAYTKPSTTSARDWHTVLVGGVRGGGRGVFALDITDPSNFSNNNNSAAKTVMWEFDSTDDADLGFTFSKPLLVQMNNDKWAVIFGNGYNATGANGDASVFILMLEEGLDGVWNLGTDYYKLRTFSGDNVNRNGMASLIAADLNADKKMDRLYGGDLNGNLWAFDISSTSPSSWGTAYGTVANPDPLFTAQTPQPITVKPEITRLTTVTTTIDNKPNVMVYFGTGQYLVNGDLSNTDQQSYYGVWDAGDSNLSVNNLQAQVFGTDENSSDGTATRVSTNIPVYYVDSPNTSNDKYGWYFDLPATGERVINQAVLFGSTLLFTTIIPDDSDCSNNGGTGFIMAVNSQNGGPPVVPILDINNDGVVDSLDVTVNSSISSGIQFSGSLPSEIALIGDNAYVSDSGSTAINTIVLGDENANRNGRLSWRELVR